MYEWTLEHATYVNNGTSLPCASRGGVFDSSGGDFPASDRYSTITSRSLYRLGFRVSLY